jgi:phosphoglycolate phosphatase
VQALLAELVHKRHIIWDWNGTLLDDLEHNVATMNWLLAAEGLPAITVDHHRRHFGFPVREYYTKLGFDTSPQIFAALCERFNHQFHSGLDRCRLTPGAKEILQHLHRAGKQQSILSATEQNTLEISVHNFGIRHYFHHVFGIKDDQAASKLERGRTLISASGVHSDDTVIIGDTLHDVEVGKELDVDVILVDHGHQHADRLQAIHHKILSWHSSLT